MNDAKLFHPKIGKTLSVPVLWSTFAELEDPAEWDAVELPPGLYSILCTAAALDEDQGGGIVLRQGPGSAGARARAAEDWAETFGAMTVTGMTVHPPFTVRSGHDAERFEVTGAGDNGLAIARPYASGIALDDIALVIIRRIDEV